MKWHHHLNYIFLAPIKPECLRNMSKTNPTIKQSSYLFPCLTFHLQFGYCFVCISTMGRSPSCDEQSGLKKGPWTTEEDEKLMDYIARHGHGSWRALPKLAGLNRCGKSCRLRWTNYLRPDIKRGKFSEDEERVIINLHSVVGNKYVNFSPFVQLLVENFAKL